MSRIVLEQANLHYPVDLERGLAMQYLIVNEEWWFEADWDGHSLGDIHIFRHNPEGIAATRDKIRNRDPRTREELYYTRGQFFGMVPASQVKCYRIRGNECPPTVRELANAQSPQVTGQPKARQPATGEGQPQG